MAAATTYTLTAPATATTGVGVASGNFSLAADDESTAVVTPSDNGAGGTFTPTTRALNNTTPVTFTYTPARDGAITISTTNAGGLTNPAPVTYQGQVPVTWPTEFGNADMAIDPATPKIIVAGEAADAAP